MKSFLPLTVCLLWLLNTAQEGVAKDRNTGAVNDSTVNHWKSYFDGAYGNDYNLVNGIKYLNLYPRAEGHPFLGPDQFFKGKLVVNDRIYEGVDLKYDICRQQLILRYPHFSGSTEQIILVNENITEFEIQGKTFRKYNIPGKGERFCQVLAGDSISCLYYWKINLVKGSSYGQYHKYLPETKEAYLLRGQEVFPFRNRRSFVDLFLDAHQKDIKRYLRSNAFSFREAGDNEMRRLIEFCDEITGE